MVHGIRETLERAGLNHLGLVAGAAWDATQPPARRTGTLFPGTRSILVVANGGRALWDAFLDDLRRDPSGLTTEAHPLDAFVERAVRSTEAAFGDVPRRWFWATDTADVVLDFRVLAQLAGLGAPSRLGLLLDARFGPWVGLRAACFLAADVPDLPAPALPAPDLCAPCEAPCRAACPGGSCSAAMASMGSAALSRQ